MARPSGFTLIEVMVAIVLMSVVALTAYGAARVSFDAHARLGGALRTQQRVRATRELLQDVLRNARMPQRSEDTTFALHGEHLSFVAAGAGPPFDPDYDWRITIGPDSGGLELVAVPLGRGPPTEVRLHLPDVTRWEVQVLASDEPTWLRVWPAAAWPAATSVPRAVAITLWDRSGSVDVPLEVALVSGGTPTPEASGAR